MNELTLTYRERGRDLFSRCLFFIFKSLTFECVLPKKESTHGHKITITVQLHCPITGMTDRRTVGRRQLDTKTVLI